MTHLTHLKLKQQLPGQYDNFCFTVYMLYVSLIPLFIIPLFSISATAGVDFIIEPEVLTFTSGQSAFDGLLQCANITILDDDVSFLKHVIEGPRTRVGQPKMKYWKLHELDKNEVKNVHPI